MNREHARSGVDRGAAARGDFYVVRDGLPTVASVRRRESNNAAIRAALKANPGKRHIATSAVEHSSVLNYCMALEGNRGIRELREKVGRVTSCAPFEPDLQNSGAQRSDAPYRVTYLPVDREGLLKLADLENAITDETAVVSLMWANNETGVLFPVKEILVLSDALRAEDGSRSAPAGGRTVLVAVSRCTRAATGPATTVDNEY